MGVAKMIRTYQASTKIGTPVYMAPEMFEDDYGIEVDIWALGILYIELILGKRIFQLLKGEEIPAKRSTFPSNDLLQKITD
jgi:serine/threonine protein kinase